MEEIWKKIPDFKHYEVSDRGRVKRLHHVIIRRNGSPDTKRELILKHGVLPSGYRFVYLQESGRKKRYYVHRLVLLVFEGFSPLEVDHLDRNPSNNKLDNLRYLTTRLNIRRRLIHKTSKFVGVHFVKYREDWKAQIGIEGKQYHLGYHSTEERHRMLMKKHCINGPNTIKGHNKIKMLKD